MTARGDEEDQGTPGAATSQTGWKATMPLWLERHKIAISGGPWSPKSLMDMEPVIDWVYITSEYGSPVTGLQRFCSKITHPLNSITMHRYLSHLCCTYGGPICCWVPDLKPPTSDALLIIVWIAYIVMLCGVTKNILPVYGLCHHCINWLCSNYIAPILWLYIHAIHMTTKCLPFSCISRITWHAAVH